MVGEALRSIALWFQFKRSRVAPGYPLYPTGSIENYTVYLLEHLRGYLKDCMDATIVNSVVVPQHRTFSIGYKLDGYDYELDRAGGWRHDHQTHCRNVRRGVRGLR